MAEYSVADAKNRLPSLIDKALAGEQVVIILTRQACRRASACLGPSGAGHRNSRVVSRPNARSAEYRVKLGRDSRSDVRVERG